MISIKSFDGVPCASFQIGSIASDGTTLLGIRKPRESKELYITLVNGEHQFDLDLSMEEIQHFLYFLRANGLIDKDGE